MTSCGDQPSGLTVRLMPLPFFALTPGAVGAARRWVSRTWRRRRGCGHGGVGAQGGVRAAPDLIIPDTAQLAGHWGPGETGQVVLLQPLVEDLGTGGSPNTQ